VQVHISWTKQMVMVFFVSRGLIYMHNVPSRGASINATYAIKALGKFLEHFDNKRPAMAQ
jgi:hypothetical protein